MTALCWLFGHNWKYHSQCQRHCLRCLRAEAVFENRFPKIGEPQYEWHEFPSDGEDSIMHELPHK